MVIRATRYMIQKKQSKQDRRLRDKPVFLNLIKRRFRCVWCGKVWTEPDPVFGTRRRSSQRFRDYLGQEALHQTVKRTAEKEMVGEGLVRRYVTEVVGKMLEKKETTATPELIGGMSLGSAGVGITLLSATRPGVR